MRRKEKIERVRQVTELLCAPKLGDHVRVRECLIPEHKSLDAPCYSLSVGMVGQERVVTKTMMYTFPHGARPLQIWLTEGGGHPEGWWLTRHQFEIIDG